MCLKVKLTTTPVTKCLSKLFLCGVFVHTACKKKKHHSDLYFLYSLSCCFLPPTYGCPLGRYLPPFFTLTAWFFPDCSWYPIQKTCREPCVSSGQGRDFLKLFAWHNSPLCLIHFAIFSRQTQAAKCPYITECVIVCVCDCVCVWGGGGGEQCNVFDA